MNSEVSVPICLKPHNAPGISCILDVADQLRRDGHADAPTFENIKQAVDAMIKAMTRDDDDETVFVSEWRYHGSPVTSLENVCFFNNPNLVALTRTLSRRAASVDISLETAAGDLVRVPCSPEDDIFHLKHKIEELRCMPHDYQCVRLGGDQLADNRLVGESGIAQGGYLFMTLRRQRDPHFPNQEQMGEPEAYAQVANETVVTQRCPSASVPKWRGCRAGINHEGRCQNESCKGYRKMVINPISIRSHGLGAWGYPGHVQCLLCFTKMEPLACGVYDCVWKWEAKRKSDKKWISSPWQLTPGGVYHRITSKDSDYINWESLIVVAKTHTKAKGAGLVFPDGDFAVSTCSLCWTKLLPVVQLAKAACGHCFHATCLHEWMMWSRASGCP